MDKLFKIHCSQIGKIMGRVGLTEAQLEEMETLSKKERRTKIQEEKLHSLIYRYNNPKLPETCQTFLKEWYANDHEEIHSKYMHKGNIVEIDLIDFMADQLNLGFVEKNTITLHNEFMVGTCDVQAADTIYDVKAAWSKKTLNDTAESGLSSDYEWQGRGYMCLYDKPNFVVFHGLMNTPEECTYGSGEIVYDDLPPNERWVAFRIQRDVLIEQEIINRVIECRKWLEEYHHKIIATLGKVH